MMVSAHNSSILHWAVRQPIAFHNFEVSRGSSNWSLKNYPGSRGVADIVSVTMPLLSIKDLAVAISTRAGPAEDDPPLYKLGSKPVQAVW